MRRLTPAALSAVLLTATLAAARPPALAAQISPLSAEGRGGASLPIGDFRTGPDQGGTLRGAPTFGVHFVYRGPSGWGPYVGFSQHRFGCRRDGCPAGADGAREYVDTNWDLGMQRTLGKYLWLRAGFLFGRLERDFDVAGRPARRVSSLSAGAEGGAGFHFPIQSRIWIGPGVRWGWLNTRFPDHGLVRMRWLAADVGMALGF